AIVHILPGPTEARGTDRRGDGLLRPTIVEFFHCGIGVRSSSAGLVELEFQECCMKDGKDAANLPIKDKVPVRDGTPPQAGSHLQGRGTPVAATSSNLSDNENREAESIENMSQRSTKVTFKTSKSGFSVPKADIPHQPTE